MPLSPYALAFPCPESPGHLLLFSTVRGGRARVTRAAWERLRAGEAPFGAAEALARAGLWVDDPEAERRRVLAYLDEVNRADPGVTAAVVLGLACNFACPYCYEGPVRERAVSGQPSAVSEGGVAPAANPLPAMSPATADRTAALLLDRLGPGRDRLTVDFYGGEPLLHLPLIRRIAAALRPGSESRGARFRFSLVTNGSLLTPAVVDELLPLGLASAKVTLDGPPEVHDRSRPLRSGRGSFAAILRNLRAVAGRVPVAVGGNVTRESWHAFPRLLDLLAAEGLGPDRVARVQFAPVVGAASCGGCVSSAEPWVAEAAASLRAETLRRGYRVPRLAPTPCMVDLDHALTVGWDGTLTKCPALVGRPEFAAGDLWLGPRDHRAAYGGERWQGRAECRACPHLPLCFGGCRYLALERTGTPASLDCQRPFLDAALGPMLAQDATHRGGMA